MTTHSEFENGGLPTKLLIFQLFLILDCFNIIEKIKWTCQIVFLIIIKHATMSIFG